MALPILRSSSKSLVALDWDSRTVRVVSVKLRSDGLDVVRAASIPVPPEVLVREAEPFGKFLRSALNQAGIRVSNALVCIPRDRVVTNIISVPPTPNDELAAIIQFQMIKELPFGPDEATLDFAIHDGDPSEPREALVAAVRKDVLDYYRAVAESAGLNLKRVGLRPYANLVAVSACRGDVTRGSTLFVDIGPEMTEIDILVDGRLSFARAASVRLPTQFAEADKREERLDDSRIIKSPLVDAGMGDAFVEQAVEDLSIEVTRSVAAFRSQAGLAKLDRIVIAGATGVESAFAQVLAERLGTRADLFNPSASLNLSDARSRELRGFSAVLGLAMSHRRPELEQINFDNPKKSISRQSKQLAKARVAVVAAILFFAAGVVGFQEVMKEPRSRQEALKKIADDLNKRLKTAGEFERDFKVVDDWYRNTRPWLDDLVRITRVFPPDTEAYLLSIDFKESLPHIPAMTLSMRTTDLNTSKDLLTRINELGQYDARPGRAQPSPGKDGMQFQDTLSIFLKRGKSDRGKDFDPYAILLPEDKSDETTVTPADAGSGVEGVTTPATEGGNASDPAATPVSGDAPDNTAPTEDGDLANSVRAEETESGAKTESGVNDASDSAPSGDSSGDKPSGSPAADGATPAADTKVPGDSPRSAAPIRRDRRPRTGNVTPPPVPVESEKPLPATAGR